MEYCKFGSLDNVLKNCRYYIDHISNNVICWDSNNRILRNKTGVRNISTRHVLIWALHITSAIQFLHSRDIVHGDLTLQNVLLDTNNVVKVTDFGLSQCNKWDEVNMKMFEINNVLCKLHF